MKALTLRVPPGSPIRYNLQSHVELPYLPEPLRIEIEHSHRQFMGHAKRMAEQRIAGKEFESGLWRKLALDSLVGLIKRCATHEVMGAANAAGFFDVHREIAALLNLQLCAVIFHGGVTPENQAEVRHIVWSSFRIKPPSRSMALTLECVYRAAGGYNQLN